MRRIGVVLLLVTLVTTIWYFFAYLTLVGVEPGPHRGRLDGRRRDRSRRDPAAVEAGQPQPSGRRGGPGRAHQGPARGRAVDSKSFAWLRDPNQTNVFIPVLLGAGVLASGLAWLVERIARLTSRSGNTTSLSKDLAALAPPEGGFLGGEDPIDLLQRPVTR